MKKRGLAAGGLGALLAAWWVRRRRKAAASVEPGPMRVYQPRSDFWSVDQQRDG